MSGPVVVPTTPTLFGREPAMLLQLVAGLVIFLSSAIYPLDIAQQGAINTVIAAIVGLAIALKVKGGTWAAALIGLGQALIAAALAYKLALSPELQVGIMTLLTTAVGYATRQVVVAPQAAPSPGSSVVA